MQTDLLELLLALDGVRQDPRYHPEGDALYHSLQAFTFARRETDDRVLWAAALFHDVGKAITSPDHDKTGAPTCSMGSSARASCGWCRITSIYCARPLRRDAASARRAPLLIW